MKSIRIFAGILVSLLFISVTSLAQNTVTDNRSITVSSEPIESIEAILINSPEFSVESGGSISIRSGEGITLKPGFHAKAGSNVHVSVNPEFKENLIATPQIQDNGSSANISVTYDNYDGNVSYLWSTGETTPTINIIDKGYYTVQITDPLERTATAEFAYGSSQKNLDAAPAKNWVKARTYDAAGNLIGEGITFSDQMGKAVQTQSRNLEKNLVLATQTVYDQQGRPTISSLPTSINTTNSDELSYEDGLMLDLDGNNYGWDDFLGLDSPQPLNNMVSNTVGWYYSNNNTLETHTPASLYAFTQQEYSKTQPGQVRKSAMAGEHHKMGSGHEIQAYALHAGAGEIEEIYGFLAQEDKDRFILSGLTKQVSVDADGKIAVSYTDSRGNNISGCLGNSDVRINATLHFQPEIAYLDVHLPLNQFSLTEGSVKVIDLSNDLEIASASSGGNLNGSGFYRLIFNGTINTENTVSINYSVNYDHHSLQVYNKTGLLIKSYSPYAVGNNLTDMASTYTYNSLGWLMHSYSPDQGSVHYKYDTDGAILFSQNALQAQNNYFSYSKYDAARRVIEVGEYRGSITFEQASRTSNLIAADCYDVVTTTYDLMSLSPELQATGFVQFFTNGNVSRTTSYGRDQNNNEFIKTESWYSYNYNGTVKEIAQYLDGLGYKFIEYQYDNIGNVTLVTYQKGESDEFVHRYVYDADKRLKEVYTRRPGQNEVLQAKYEYYTHGPLKRVELANDLQGIDYVYTINGWLKSINHPELTNDPGNDANDIFGMALDYYSGDYTRANTNITSNHGSNYGGNIAQQRWKNEKANTIMGTNGVNWAYRFTYNRNNWLQSATMGRMYNGHFTAENGKAFTVDNLVYDLNGNIQSLNRYDLAGPMDELTYHYNPTLPNRLTHIGDNAPTTPDLISDLETQSSGNYTYDAIGQLTSNLADDHYFSYDVFGKVTSVKTNTNARIGDYMYNEGGFRFYKHNRAASTENWYVRDASGIILAIYEATGGGEIALSELPLYGASRLGMTEINGSTANYKYELHDHLGNVRATVYRENNLPQLYTFADYYPFGMEMPGRTSTTQNFRFGYQGQFAEKDEETGYNQFESRLYDARIGRWMVPDPAGQYWSPYLGMGNNWPNGVDPNGEIFGGVRSWFNVLFTGGERYQNEYGDWVVSKGDNVYMNFGGGGFQKRHTPDYGNNSESFGLLGDGIIYDGSTMIEYDLRYVTADERGPWSGRCDPVYPEAFILMEIKMVTLGEVTVTAQAARTSTAALRNGHLAGKLHPVTKVPFTKSGFPNFSKHLYQGGKNNVFIKPTGTRAGDFAAANRAAGYTSTPKGFTWHHHQTTGRMQLVNSKIHSQTGHTGGFSLWGN